MTHAFALESPPAFGDLRLKLETSKKDSAKTTYRVHQFQKGAGPRGMWRKTLYRIEWFPRKKTWRLVETRPDYTKAGHTWWEQVTLADFGDIPETDAVEIALSTLAMLGKP